MDFNDIDKALDMRLIIAYSGKLPIAQFTKKFDFSFQSALHFAENQLELSYFIPEEYGTNREVSIFLAQSSARKEGDVFFVNYPLSMTDIFGALSENVALSRSLVVDGMLLRGGTYYLSLRFHSSELTKISQAILKYSETLEDLSISFLGHNPGMPGILETVKKTVNLRSFSWRVEVPEEYLKKPPFSSFPDEWVAETRFLTSGKVLSQIVKTEEPLKHPEESGVYTISEDLNLYELSWSSLNPFLESYFASMYEARSVRFWRCLHFHDGVLEFRTVTPTVLSGIMLKALTKSHESYPEWKLVMTNVFDF